MSMRVDKHDEQVREPSCLRFKKKELVEYCESDIQLLKQGSLNFELSFEQMSKLNLWDKITIAAACNRDLHQNRVTPNTTANKPIHGWRLHASHSKVAL